VGSNATKERTGEGSGHAKCGTCLTQEMLRDANSRITLELYAQSNMTAKLEENGRPEWTRTIDLFRVKVRLTHTPNSLDPRGGTAKPR